jgi:general stress protein YciG
MRSYQPNVPLKLYISDVSSCLKYLFLRTFQVQRKSHTYLSKSFQITQVTMVNPEGTFNPGNFANRPTDEVQEIAAKGGHASHGGGRPAAEDLPGAGNPGNFANRPKEEVQEIAAMGGRASHGGGRPAAEEHLPGDGNPGNFAKRPTEEVREIAAKGGRASHGADGGATGDLPGGGNPGNFANRPKEEVREAGAKGGHASSVP